MLRLNLAILAGKIISISQRLLEITYDAFIPPLLGYKGMEQLINYNYSLDPLCTTSTHNSSGLYLWEAEALAPYLCEGKRCVVLAAGAGREAIALAKVGIQVDAYECNEKLRHYGNQLLKEQSLPFSIQPMMPSRIPEALSDKKFDFCIIGWSAYSHILKKEDRIGLLKDIREISNCSVLISFPGAPGTHRLKESLRRIAECLPGATKGLSGNLIARPGFICVGFGEKDIYDEAAAAGFIVERYKNQRPEYPYAVISPKIT